MICVSHSGYLVGGEDEGGVEGVRQSSDVLYDNGLNARVLNPPKLLSELATREAPPKLLNESATREALSE